MKLTARRLFLLVVLGSIALLPAALAQENYSHARIVRLSFVEGTVTVQRPDQPDWAAASVNIPLQEGFKLSTAENSFAEVEFENSSTARIGQLSLLEFTQLALAPDGSKVNRLTLDQGYATFNVVPQDQDDYEITAAGTTLTAQGKTEFRADIDNSALRVEVFKGSVEASTPSGSQTLSKDMVLEFNPANEQPLSVSEGITKDDWDQWVNDRDKVIEAEQNQPTPGIYSPGVRSLYGWNDLSGYGYWALLPGYGYGWTPYAAAGWSPFTQGRWSWYPGFGYTWISFEPWGWLPYHYGGWIFGPGIGWCWIPGGFNSWSPAQVTWHQGAGWIGWTPRGPGNNNGGAIAGGTAGRRLCGPSQGCGTIVRPVVVQNGLPVTGRAVQGIDSSTGQQVATPDAQPSRLGMLPGAPFARTAGAAANDSGIRTFSGNAQVGSGSNQVVVVGRQAPVQTGVISDSATGRFVNNPGGRPSPVISGSASPQNSRGPMTGAVSPRFAPSVAPSAAPAGPHRPAGFEGRPGRSDSGFGRSAPSSSPSPSAGGAGAAPRSSEGSHFGSFGASHSDGVGANSRGGGSGFGAASGGDGSQGGRAGGGSHGGSSSGGGSHSGGHSK